MNKYPKWSDFNMDEIHYGFGAPYCAIGVYTSCRSYSWPDMECVTEDELKRWQKWIISRGFEVPKKYLSEITEEQNEDFKKGPHD